MVWIELFSSALLLKGSLESIFKRFIFLNNIPESKKIKNIDPRQGTSVLKRSSTHIYDIDHGNNKKSIANGEPIMITTRILTTNFKKSVLSIASVTTTEGNSLCCKMRPKYAV